jgi:hypothetical protein
MVSKSQITTKSQCSTNFKKDTDSVFTEEKEAHSAKLKNFFSCH